MIARKIKRYANFFKHIVVVFSLLLASGCSLFHGASILEDHRFEVALAVSNSTNEVTVAFLGVTTLLFTDGETTLMTDGFFSRPKMSAIILDKKIEPNKKRIADSLLEWNIENLDALLVGHSHFDHAMDVAEVAIQTEALVLGSESTRKIALGGNLPPEQVYVVKAGRPMSFGKFTVTFYKSKHFPLKIRRSKLLGTAIDKPLIPPARVSDYAEGQTYSILIEHPQGNAIVQPSAGYLVGALDNIRADVVFLGIATPFRSDTDYIDSYWNNVVKATGAKRVLPIHWDNPAHPLSTQLRTTPLIFDNVLATLLQLVKNGKAEGRRVELLPVGQPVALFDLVQ
nr:MBL fold metallo-hydrolase [Granulosicoccus sp.]